jgi:hypothetical protein
MSGKASACRGWFSSRREGQTEAFFFVSLLLLSSTTSFLRYWFEFVCFPKHSLIYKFRHTTSLQHPTLPGSQKKRKERKKKKKKRSLLHFSISIELATEAGIFAGGTAPAEGSLAAAAVVVEGARAGINGKEK